MSERQQKRQSYLMLKHRQSLHDRAITDEVIDGARGICRYVSYRHGDERSLLRWAPDYANQRWLKSILSSDGIIIIRRELIAATWDPDLKTAIPHAHLTPQVKIDRPPFEEAKYLFPKDSRAKLIDCHPMAKNRVRNGNAPQYFCLEGSLNADAVLSAGWPAYSVPGVGSWDAENLWDVIPSMQKAPVVYIVTDNDWRTNPQVALQALKAYRELHDHRGVPAVAMAPPLSMPEKSGVGDMLAAGRPLDDLERIPLGPPDKDLIADRIDQLPPRARDRARTLVRALVKMQTPAFHTSTVKGMADKTRKRAVLDLSDAKVIEKTKDFKHRWNGETWVSDPATWAWELGLLS